MTVYPPHIHQELRDYYIFLDTNVFIYASKNRSFFDFLASLKNDANCSFATIPSVVFEFTNHVDSIEQYNDRIAFVNSLTDRVDPMRFLSSITDFYVVMSRTNGQNSAYTDFLLAACLYNYAPHVEVALLTADLKALPAFYPRTHILAIDHGREIKNFAVHGFDPEGYAAAAAKVLAESVEARPAS